MINFQMMIHKYGKSPNETIRDYINIRYERWLDYSKYKCSHAKMEGHEVDVLDEVLLNVLQKDERRIMELLSKKKIQKEKEYTELDFFILRALSVNITSETSPYRYKNKPIPSNSNVDLRRLNIIDETDNEPDRSADILKEMRLVTWVLAGLQLTESERRVFQWKFLQGNSLCSDDYTGPETQKQRYKIYNEVEAVIHNVLYYYGFTTITPRGKLTSRQSELCDCFVRTRKIHINKNQLVNI